MPAAGVVNVARVLWLLVALAVAAGCGSAAAWQWRRAAWKERLLAAEALAARAPPRALAAVLDDAPSLPDREDVADPAATALPLRVEARGRYDESFTVMLDHQRHEGRVGVRVYTGLRIDAMEAGRVLLVERGFLPLPPDRSAPVLAAAPSGEVVLHGTLRRPPSQGLRLGHTPFVPGAAPPLLASLDLDALARESGRPLLPAVLVPDAGAPGELGPHPPPLANTLPPAQHRGYAVQWGALGLAALVLYAVLAFRRRRGAAVDAR